MTMQLLDRHGIRIVECTEEIVRVDDALALIAACLESGSTRLLIEACFLPAAFFDLRSRFAGEFLQKLQNYNLQLAAVLPADSYYGERFSEFLAEAKRGRSFRA